MNTNTTKRFCVLRNVAGMSQYVAIEDARFLNPGETAFYGSFTEDRVKDGPSGSDTRIVCDPVGALTRVKVATVGRTYGVVPTGVCVLRDLSFPQSGGDYQYLDAGSVPTVQAGETLFVGQFLTESGKFGPYGSDRRTIYLPAGNIVREQEAVAA